MAEVNHDAPAGHHPAALRKEALTGSSYQSYEAHIKVKSQ
jgi:hypothetical protein